MRKMYEMGDKSRTELPDNNGPGSILQAFQKPVNQFPKCGVGIAIVQRLGVQLHDESQGTKEPDIVALSSKETLGYLPAVRRFLKFLEDFLNLGYCGSGVLLIESIDQLVKRQM
jgi:hypothetical protein